MTDVEKIKDAIRDLKDVHNIYDVMCGDWSFCWTAIESLEKQIPKDVEVEESVNKYKEPIKRYWCPACECEVDKDRDNYCSQCGQHLLWEEDNGSK